jgi:hypothetical protein
VDELELLKTMRTDARPTADERAHAAEQLMTFIEDGEVTRVVELTPVEPRKQPSRSRTYAACISVAAVVVLVALIAWSAGEGGGPLRSTPSAAAALRKVATTVEHATYPPTPYAVNTRMESSAPDGLQALPKTIATGPVDSVIWTFDQGDTISTVPACAAAQCTPMFQFHPQSLFAPGATAADVRATIQQRVDAALAQDGNQISRDALTLSAVSEALLNPTLGPAARAELLRIIAGLGNITARADVANGFGLKGTRYSAVAGDNSIVVVIDPTHGYLLQQQSSGITLQGGADGAAPLVQVATRISYDRPQPAAPLPPAVATLATQVRAHAPGLDPRTPFLGCVVGAPGLVGGITVPNGFVFTHCPAS